MEGSVGFVRQVVFIHALCGSYVCCTTDWLGKHALFGGTCYTREKWLLLLGVTGVMLPHYIWSLILHLQYDPA